MRDSNIKSHLKEFEDNLKIFVGIVKILGKTPVLMLQPLGYLVGGARLFNNMIRNVADTEALQ